MSYDLIIPTTPQSRSLDLCLSSIVKNKYINKIILVNNNLEELKKENFKRINYLKILNINSKKNSIAKSWNIGIVNSNSNYFIISNDDVIYGENSLDKLYEEYLKSQYSVLCPIDFYAIFKLKDRLFNILPEEIELELKNKKFYSFFNAINSHLNNDVLSSFELQNANFSKFIKPEEIINDVYGNIESINEFWLRLKPFIKDFSVLHNHHMGFSFIISKNIINKVGMFDENFQIGYWEDVDYQKRCEFEELKWGSTENSFCHHIGSLTFNSLQNNYNFHDKNKQFLEEKEKRYYINDDLLIGTEFPQKREVPINISNTQNIKFKIDLTNVTKNGNILCFNNLLGNPLYYVWLDIINGEIKLKHGYFSEGNWINSDIYEQNNKNIIYLEIKNGQTIYINNEERYFIPEKIESFFLSFGDIRGKTSNSDADVSLEELV